MTIRPRERSAIHDCLRVKTSRGRGSTWGFTNKPSRLGEGGLAIKYHPKAGPLSQNPMPRESTTPCVVGRSFFEIYALTKPSVDAKYRKSPL